MGELGDRLRRFRRAKTPGDVDRAVRFIVRLAYRAVPVYRRLLDEKHVRPEQVRSAADLPLVPIMEKSELFVDAPLRDRMHAQARVARCARTETSGSTGFRLNILMSRSEATYRRFLLFSSWRRFARLPLSVRVADIGSWVRDESGVEVRRRGAARVLRISMALPIERKIELLNQHRPHVVSGYPTSLEILADEARGALQSPRLVVTRGEMLHDSARLAIEAAFGCPVADFYNCEEVGTVAAQCSSDPAVYHVNTDACVLEIVDAHGNPLPAGAEGQVLVTNLYNCTMPFIRYALHDRAAWIPAGSPPCGCGHDGPSIGLLSGRDDDMVHLPSGGRASPRLIATAVDRSFEAITTKRSIERLFRRFQIVQDAPDHLSIAIIPGADRSVPFEEIISPAMRRLDPELRCSVRLVDELPLEPSGKFKKVAQAMRRDTSAALSR